MLPFARVAILVLRLLGYQSHPRSFPTKPFVGLHRSTRGASFSLTSQNETVETSETNKTYSFCSLRSTYLASAKKGEIRLLSKKCYFPTRFPKMGRASSLRFGKSCRDRGLWSRLFFETGSYSRFGGASRTWLSLPFEVNACGLMLGELRTNCLAPERRSKASAGRSRGSYDFAASSASRRRRYRRSTALPVKPSPRRYACAASWERPRRRRMSARAAW
jgi:hypothetical protein